MHFVDDDDEDVVVEVADDNNNNAIFDGFSVFAHFVVVALLPFHIRSNLLLLPTTISWSYIAFWSKGARTKHGNTHRETVCRYRVCIESIKYLLNAFRVCTQSSRVCVCVCGACIFKHYIATQKLCTHQKWKITQNQNGTSGKSTDLHTTGEKERVIENRSELHDKIEPTERLNRYWDTLLKCNVGTVCVRTRTRVLNQIMLDWRNATIK